MSRTPPDHDDLDGLDDLEAQELLGTELLGTPGTAGGCVGPVARDTRAVWSLGIANVIVRVYCVIWVTLTDPIGSPMALLCPKAPLRAVPEKVSDVSESAPIAFDAAATIEVAFCAAALAANMQTRAAAHNVLVTMRASRSW